MMNKKEKIYQLGIQFKETKSEKAFASLYDTLKPALINYVYNITKDKIYAEDGYSEIMTTVYDKIEMYDKQWSITTWIYRIAKNYAYNYFRIKNKRKEHSFTELGFTNEYTTKWVENEFITSENMKEELHINKVAEDKVMSYIDSSLYLHKDILLDRFVHNYKYKDIS